jgi:hypothetical protein
MVAAGRRYADWGEPTSGLESLSCSLRVIIRALRGLARACKSPISKLFSFPRFASRCTVLRSRWCQSGVNATLVAALYRRPRLVY